MQKPYLLLVAAALILAFAAPVSAAAIGDTAVNIKLPTLAGDTFDLKDHIGEVVVLYTFGCT